MDLTPNVGDYREENTMTTPIEALRELIACKDLKDRLDGAVGSARGSLAYLQHCDEYDSRKPIAWANARAALAAECKRATQQQEYRDDLISCRDMVETELTQYERLAFMCWKLDVAENYVKEAQRLSDLLDRIDAAIKETPC